MNDILEKLVEEVGLPILLELIQAGVEHVLSPTIVIANPKTVDVMALIGGASRVRDLLPQVLPTDDESSKIQTDIDAAQLKKLGEK